MEFEDLKLKWKSFFPFIFPLVAFLSLSSCHQNSGEDITSNIGPGSHKKIPVSFTSPIPAKGKWINPDSVPHPEMVSVGPPEILPLPSHVRPAGKPRIVPVPHVARTFTPGKEGIPPLVVKRAEGRTAPALHPKPILAQSPKIKTGATANFHVIGVLQGMSSDVVHSMVEDRNGYMWFGSGGGGVSRYDGQKFIHYNEAEGLPYSSIHHLFVDSKGNLWIGTDGKGLSKYDGNHFTHFAKEEGFTDKTVEATLEDRHGNLWFGTGGGGVIKYDGLHFTHFTTEAGLQGNNVYSVLEDAGGNIWFCVANDGIYRYDGKSIAHIPIGEGRCGHYVVAMLQDKNGDIWLGDHNSGVCRLSEQQFYHYTTQEGLSSNAVRTMLEDEAGEIWIGTENSGLNKFDGNGFTLFTSNDGLANDQIGDIMEDRKGNLWISTFGSGVTIYMKNSIELYQNIAPPEVEDLEGNLLTSTGEGLIVKNPSTNNRQFHKMRSIGSSNRWEATLQDEQGNTWVAIRGEGVRKFDGKNVTYFTAENGLPHNEVSCLFEDSRGHLWVGAHENGVVRYDGDSFTHFSEKGGLGHNHVHDIHEDQEGNIWIASNEIAPAGGISVYDGQYFTHLTEENGLSSNQLNVLHQDQKGNMWIGTWNKGLNIYAAGNLTVIDKNDGLSNNIIQCIVEDRKGRFWISTEQGLNLLIPKTDGSETYQIITFGEEDGILDPSIGSGFLDTQNRLWYSQFMIDLNRFQLPKSPPRIQLDHIELQQSFIDYRRLADTTYRKTLPYGREIQASFDSVARFNNYPISLELPYQVNHLSFHFSAIDWVAPHKILYQFKLEGVDQAWSPPTPENKVDYHSLSHGTYTFKVRAAGQNVLWSEPFAYTFRINPPWWLSWWAYAFYGVIFIGIIVGLRRYELKRYLTQMEARRLQELDQLKTRLYTNITHEFRTPLTVIMGMAENIKGQNSERNIIKRNGQQLLRLVNQMLDLSKFDSGALHLDNHQSEVIAYLNYLVESFYSMATEKEIRLTFYSEEPVLVMDFDEVKLQHVIYNLLSNAIKFTPENGKVILHAQKMEAAPQAQLKLKIIDTGKGIPQESLPHIFDRFFQIDDSLTRTAEGTGIGLALTKEYVEFMGGIISVESTLGKGTEFQVLLPITHKAPIVEPAYLEEATNPGRIESEEVVNSNDKPIEHSDASLPLVLIVEDNRDVVSYIYSILKNNYRVETAPNGRAGLEKAIELVPDIIISDVMMPEMDGFELTRKLKNDVRTSHIPIIMLTAKAEEQDRITGLQSGADAYLSKPFNKAEMMVRLEKLTALREALRKRYADMAPLPSSPSTPPTMEDVFLENAQQVVKKNLDNPDFTVAYFCRSMRMSQSQLYRKLMALTGKSPTLFIRHIRLHKAADLLRSTNLNVSEVAWQTGFNDPSYFSRAFHQEFGKPPSEWRN